MSGRRAKLARRLIEPDIWTCPHGARQRPRKVLTYGPEVAEVNAAADFTPDPQQELGLDLIFAINPDGTPASFEVCVICCRQNLKTGLFKQTAVGWVVVLDEHDVVWSAHEMSTTRDAQRDLHEMFESAPSLSRLLPATKNRGNYDENGEERIELASGQTIWFKARRENSGRGLARGKLVLDEAFALKKSMLGSLLPLMLTKPYGQVLYGSSAGKADSDALFEIRDRGKKHVSPRLTYLEWNSPKTPCADPDCTHPKDAVARDLRCALDDEKLWAKANPTLSTGRITLETMRNLRQAMPVEEFMRECLGWWDDPGAAVGPPAVDLARWQALEHRTAPAPARVTVVVDVEPNRSAATLGVVGDGPGGKPLVLVDMHDGMHWVAGTLLDLKAHAEVLEVALHPSGQAGALAPQLRAAGIEFKTLVHKDMSHGCSGFQTAVETAGIRHVGQADLDAAVAAARIRTVSEAQLWDRANTSVQLGPIVAGSVALQRWLALTAKPKAPPPPPVRSSGSGRTARLRELDVATAGF